MPSPDLAKLKALMAGPDISPLPWNANVEEYDTDKDGTVIAGLITIDPIERTIHDTEYAESEDWPRDLANAQLLVAAVNAAPALLDEIERLQSKLQRIGKMLCIVNDIEKHDPEQLVYDTLEAHRKAIAAAKTLGAAEELCTDPDKYYVYSQRDAKAGYAGGSIVWWRAKGNGYARDLKGAGVFTIEDYLKGYPNPSHCVYVPCNRVVDAAFKSETLVWEKNLPKAKQLAKEIEARAAELRKELA